MKQDNNNIITADDLISLENLIARWNSAGEDKSSIYDICNSQDLQWFLSMTNHRFIQVNDSNSVLANKYESIDVCYIKDFFSSNCRSITIKDIRKEIHPEVTERVSFDIAANFYLTTHLIGKKTVKFDEIFVSKQSVMEVEKHLKIQPNESQVNSDTATKRNSSNNDGVDDDQEIKKHSQKQEGQARVNALHELITKYYQKAKNAANANTHISSRKVWSLIKNKENIDIIQEIDSWTAKTPKIYWISPTCVERQMTRRAFENFISKLNNPK